MSEWDEPFAGLYEAGIVLGASKQNVANLRKRKGDFPEPVAKLKMGPIWKTRDLINWKERNS